MMTKTVGTLREIGARVGDVVRSDEHGLTFEVEWFEDDCAKGTTTRSDSFLIGNDFWTMDGIDSWRIIHRATRPFNTLTAEEKGELLLANHEGKIIEMSLDSGETWDRSYTPQWIGAACYRVKADEMKEYILHGKLDYAWSCEALPSDTHRITFNLVNGKPDCASVKMEEIK